MAQGKTVTVRFNGGRYAKAPEIFQYDYGRVLAMPDIDLPDGFQVYFGSTVNGDAEPMVGQNNEVLIPDDILETSGIKYAWVFLHEGADDGETEYVVTLNVSQRGKSTEVEPTPAQQDVITETIAALNAGVATVEGIAEAIPQTIEDALTAAKESGEFDGPAGPQGEDGPQGDPGVPGNDGFSPTVEVTEITGGHEVAITDVNGTHTFDVMDGEGGGSAVSPTANVVKTGDTAVITITDKDGTTTASISDGTNGQDGADGQDGFSPTATVTKSGTTATISITDKNGTTTATVTDGTNGQDGQDGSDGADGVTFTPSVSSEGVISWTNDGGRTNPQSVNIKGPQGDPGQDGQDGQDGSDYVLTAQDKADIADIVRADMQVAVSGTTPTITAEQNVQYLCGTLSTLSFTPCGVGVCDVLFASGSTPTVLTVPNTVRWPGWFDPTSLEANAVYEISVLNGVFGAVMLWT